MKYSLATDKRSGFTIVELLIVIVVIAVLASITVVAYNGIQSRARDTGRVQKVKDISKAIELYKIDNGQYPPIQDGNSSESSCGSQTENWGHCDRNKELADMLAPYMKLDPTSLSNATQGSYVYYYNSSSVEYYQTYGLGVYLEGSGGQNDGGSLANAYEVGQNPSYCMLTYTGAGASWGWSSAQTRCRGGS